jgi:hypothetical protein
MSSRLRNFLFEAYKNPRNFNFPHKHPRSSAIQIDDQDDGDSITDFCNIFCTVDKKEAFTIELCGRFPITEEMADLVEIYNGYSNLSDGKLVLKVSLGQIEAVRDLSDKLRKTSFMGDLVNNPAWLSVSARTISSLYRFMRIIKEYRESREEG